MKRLEPLVEAAGVKFQGVKIDPVNGLENGLDAVLRARPDGVLVAAAPAFYNFVRISQPIIAFMAANRLPASSNPSPSSGESSSRSTAPVNLSRAGV